MLRRGACVLGGVVYISLGSKCYYYGAKIRFKLNTIESAFAPTGIAFYFKDAFILLVRLYL